MPLRTKIIKKNNSVYVVELHGSLDSETSEPLEEKLKEIINETTRAVIFDMADLDYISSMGIGLIMKTKKSLESNMATFAMTNLQHQIKTVLDAIKILPLVDIFEDMPEADKYIDQIIKEEIKNAK